MIQTERWLELYREAILGEFGERVLFIGLQGSRARGEATDRSDIDVVLVLDRMGFEDLGRYREVVSKLPCRELLCGFVSGREELECWDRADLFQFYFDTKAVYRSLDDIISVPTEEEARRAALVGACGIYHACSHNYLHERNPDALRGLCKSVRFVMQADAFCENGYYTRNREELRERVGETGRELLTAIGEDSGFDRLSRLILEWASDVISRRGE